MSLSYFSETISAIFTAGLVAYTFREKKPLLNIRVKERLALPALVF